jgi:hypothetical protein
MGSPGLKCGVVWPFFRDQFSVVTPVSDQEGYSQETRAYEAGVNRTYTTK